MRKKVFSAREPPQRLQYRPSVHTVRVIPIRDEPVVPPLPLTSQSTLESQEKDDNVEIVVSQNVIAI